MHQQTVIMDTPKLQGFEGLAFSQQHCFCSIYLCVFFSGWKLSFQNFKSWKHIYTVGETNNKKTPATIATFLQSQHLQLTTRAGDPYLFSYPERMEMNIWVGEDMCVSKNRGTPRSSILIGFSNIHHPFWGTIIFGNTHICNCFFFWQGIHFGGSTSL